MSEHILASAAAIGITAKDADALLGSGDGDAALLYLYLLRRGGGTEIAQAASDLHRSGRDIRAAAECLQRLGLLGGAPAAEPAQPVLETPVSAPAPVPAPAKQPEDRHLEPAPELPQYTIRDITGDPQFREIVRETENLLGRVLGDGETRRLFGIYREYGYPAEIILLIIQYLMDRSASNGNTNRPGFKAIENEARFWYTTGGVRTYEDAERWAAGLQERRGLRAQIMQVLGLAGREPVKSERDYIDSWIGMGFAPDALAVAYDRTVTNTGKLSWQYMDRIVHRWHDNNLHTVQEILNGDTRPARRDTHRPAQQPGITREENDLALAQMARIVAGMHGGQNGQNGQNGQS